jgi:hypothetical protein
MILPAMRALTFCAATLCTVVVFAACAPVPRAAECDLADACDQALEQPFGSFAKNDPQFGDDLDGDGDAAEGDVGTCWQNAETAKPCVDECTRFVAEQRAIAEQQENGAVLAACGA